MKIAISDIVIPKDRERSLNKGNISSLAESMKEIGLLQPIVITENNELISGLHRIEAAKILGWTDVECITINCNDIDRKLAEIDENLIRAELSVLERAEHLKRRKELYETKYPETKSTNKGGAFRGNQYKKVVKEIISPTFTEDVATKLCVSPRTIRQEVQIAEKIDDEVKEIIKNTSIADSKIDLLELSKIDDSEKQKQVAEKIKNGIKKVKEAVREIRKEEEIKKAETVTLPSAIDIRYGDFREVLKDIEQVDAIITDPPYPSEFLPLWQDLGIFAKEKLKEGGYLVAYTGQYHLPEVLATLSKHLDYVWTFCLHLQGETQIVNGVNVMCRWKPVLIFQKGKTKFTRTIQDYVVSEQREKNGHNWQQSITGVKRFIELFTDVGNTVCDPFVGSGTTAEACKQLKRKFIGAEIDEKTYKIAIGRVGI
jgi:16S rRNA G966 N2-methylase RsmD